MSDFPEYNEEEAAAETVQPREKIKLPTIAIVGRPNVGKSSLFNAIVGRRVAIVHEACGVTRDRLVAPTSWDGRHFMVVDTGGIGTYTGQEKGTDIWDLVIRRQAEAAIEGADVLILVVNVQDGVMPLDLEVAKYLHASGKRIFLAVNKVDDPVHENQVSEFNRLGYKDIYPVSCLHRRGVDMMMDDVLSEVTAPTLLDKGLEPFKIAVIGRPNVGKSSLINSLLGEERVIVSDIAGTTRDSIDIDFKMEFNGEMMPVHLIDTAGLRKKARLKDAIEMFSVMRTEEAIKRSNLVLFMVEAKHDGVTAQDRKISSIIQESGKPCLIVANKWDICDEQNQKMVMEEIRYSMPGMDYAPVVFTSARTRFNLGKLLDYVGEVRRQTEIAVPTSVVNKVLEDALAKHSPPVVGKTRLKIYYGTMVGSEPPTFLLFVNKKENCADNYLSYLVNFFRASFGMTGLPLAVRLKERPKTIPSIRASDDGRKRVRKAVNEGRPGGKPMRPKYDPKVAKAKRANGPARNKAAGPAAPGDKKGTAPGRKATGKRNGQAKLSGKRRNG